jgi:endonuclease/exonuclease/phosphatase family metal-dependent hydrolase
MSSTIIRIMTYQVDHCRGRDGKVDPDRISQVIACARPDIVALQGIDAEAPFDHLIRLEQRLGLKAYSPGRRDCNAYLSSFRLAGLREYDLGQQGVCLRADADVHGKRLHLFNIRLQPALTGRIRQIHALLGSELLGDDALVCPVMVLGDFGDFFWNLGNLELNMRLRPVARPLWRATYPACFPVVGRDRAYLRGQVKVTDSFIERSPLAREASSHLPLILTTEIHEPARTLRVKEIKRTGMEVAAG